MIAKLAHCADLHVVTRGEHCNQLWKAQTLPICASRSLSKPRRLSRL